MVKNKNGVVMKRMIELNVDGVTRIVTETEIRNMANSIDFKSLNDKNLMDALVNYICRQMFTGKPTAKKSMLDDLKKDPVDAVGTHFIPPPSTYMKYYVPHCEIDRA